LHAQARLCAAEQTARRGLANMRFCFWRGSPFANAGKSRSLPGDDRACSTQNVQLRRAGVAGRQHRLCELHQHQVLDRHQRL